MKDIILIIPYIQDPGHGWFEVPAGLIDRAGILDQISHYSFYSHTKQVYFLEEDSDAGLFIKWCKANSIEFVLRDVYVNNFSRTAYARVGGE